MPPAVLGYLERERREAFSGREDAMSEWLTPTQIAKIVFDVFVKDVRSAIEWYSKTYGLGPWKVSELTVEEAEFRGQSVELGFPAGMLDLGPLNIELLEARGTESVVTWFEGTGDGSSWHPVAYYQKLEQAEEARDEFERRGAELVFSGRIAGSRYWVFDTERFLGCRFEIAGGELSGISFDAAE
jgi:hypothetical protein